MNIRNSKHKNLVVRVIHYLHSQNLDDLRRISIKSLSYHFSIHRVVLSRKFKEEMRMPLSKYLAMVRINKGAELLKNRLDLPIWQISHIIGIEKPHHFRCKFKRAFGLLPNQFRKDLAG